MNTLRIRNLEFGAGVPAICIPNVGRTKEEILSLAGQYCSMHMDLMEWRADWFEGVEDRNQVKEVLTGLRKVLGDVPLLFTFRTSREGGSREISADDYVRLNREVAGVGMADLVDVELMTGDAVVKELINDIHGCGVKVVVSNHDFQKTPPREEIVFRLRRMQELGADLPKIAVMPQDKKDVLTLLSATEEMVSCYADRPVITMAMAGIGSISRISGEVFGSCLTFGFGGTASAPGQIEAEELYQTLQIVHRALS